MAEVIQFPRHKFHRCKEGEECWACNASLQFCQTCNGAESTLPTDCPGISITPEEADQISAGYLDYHLGIGWVEPGMFYSR